MYFFHHLPISKLILLCILTLFLFFIFSCNRNTRIPNGIKIEAIHSSQTVSFRIKKVGLKSNQKVESLRGGAYEIRLPGRNENPLRLKFDKTIHNIKDSISTIAYWTGSNWQELKSKENGRYLYADFKSSGTYVVKKRITPAILLVHGLGGSHETWEEFIEQETTSRYFNYVGNYNVLKNDSLTFEKEYDEFLSNDVKIYSLDLSDNQNLTFNEQASEVKAVVNEILKNDRNKKIILVGHSMGGLACRAYINNYGIRKIAGYISVTSPHMGSFLASIKRWANDKEYTDDIIGGMNKIAKNALVVLIDNAYRRISIDAKALDYLEPGSEELKSLRSKNFPRYLPVATVTSVWSLNDFAKDALAAVAEALEKKYNIVFTQAQIKKYDLEERRTKTDGIVCYHSQILEASVPNGNQLDPYHFNTSVFHTKTNKAEVLCSAVDSIISIYCPSLLNGINENGLLVVQ